MDGAQPRPTGTRAVVLIAEDNPLNLKLLNDILEFHGYTTVITGEGAAAIRLAQLYNPTFILLDVQLPDMPGTEVARRLKADNRTAFIPIIAVTAFAMPGDRAKILASGCDEYVSKPFSVRDLLLLVERYRNPVSS